MDILIKILVEDLLTIQKLIGKTNVLIFRAVQFFHIFKITCNLWNSLFLLVSLITEIPIDGHPKRHLKKWAFPFLDYSGYNLIRCSHFLLPFPMHSQSLIMVKTSCSYHPFRGPRTSYRSTNTNFGTSVQTLHGVFGLSLLKSLTDLDKGIIGH